MLKLYVLPSLDLQAQFDMADIYELDLVRILRRSPEIQEEKLFDFLQKHLEISQIEELREIVKECRQRLQCKRFI
ncbi:MAG: hypothetical protein AAF810_13090 [Cyanobacteria bacterium P01_D01_bin.36]